jgi:hypothetical protein
MIERQVPAAGVVPREAVVVVSEVEVKQSHDSVLPLDKDVLIPSSNKQSKPSNQYAHSNEEPKPSEPKGLTLRELQEIEKAKSDASRSTLYPDIVFKTKDDWDNAWDRSQKTALDRSQYSMHDVFIKHRAVEIVEFISPEEKDSMQHDYIFNYAKVDTGNITFWELLTALANPKFNGHIAVQIEGYKDPLACRPEIMKAIRLGTIRNFEEYQRIRKEMSAQEKLKRGY